MNHRVRLGPVAVFLAVIAVVLTSLAILTFATSRADLTMAQRFAEVTRIRYELETDGNQFLQEADTLLRDRNAAETAGRGESGISGTELPDGASVGEDGTLVYQREQSGYTLTVHVAQDPETGGAKVTGWKITRDWNAEDPLENIWQG